MRLLRFVALAAAALLAPASPARAAPSGPGGPPRCRIENVGAVAFGLYDPFAAAPLDGLGSMRYDCTSLPGPVITLSPGSSGSFAARTLRQGGDVLLYNVYSDAARTQVLGDGSAGSSTYDATNARKQTLVLHGRVFAGQMVARGTYADTLVVTIEF